MRSPDPGRLITFSKFDTFRRSRSDFSKVCKGSIKGVLEGASVGEENRRQTVLTNCSTHTICLESFVRGVDLKVGSKSMPDQGIIMGLMKLLIDKMEVAAKGKVSMLERRELTKKGAYLMSCFVA